MSEAIGLTSTVTLHFSLHLSSGEEVDSTFDKEPATFTIGDGNVLPGFEKVLLGLSVGDDMRTTVPAEEAFGAVNPANVQQLPRQAFTDEVTLSPGLVVSFADAAQHERPGVVMEWDDSTVTVDFNHPLAGKDIVFRAKIIEVSAI